MMSFSNSLFSKKKQASIGNVVLEVARWMDLNLLRDHPTVRGLVVIFAIKNYRFQSA